MGRIGEVLQPLLRGRDYWLVGDGKMLEGPCLILSSKTIVSSIFECIA